MQKHEYTDKSDWTETLFTVLSNKRRRMIVRIVDRLGTVSIKHAAAYIAIAEKNLDTTDPGNVSKHDRQSVYVPLYQTHIEKLADAEIISIVERDTAITIGSKFEQAKQTLRCSECD